MSKPLASTPLAPADDFVRRHVGPDDDELRYMLDTLGADTLDALLDETLPKSIRDDTLDLPAARSEPDVLAALRRFGAENKPRTSLVGMGYYPTVTPGVIQRNVLENPAWYTAYTPYQPEISQGRLEALLNFQTTITELTGLGSRQRLAARRGDSRRRGDEHGSTPVEVTVGKVLRPPRHAPADDRRALDAGASRSASSLSSATSTGLPTDASGRCSATRRRRVPSSTGVTTPLSSTTTVALLSSPPTCWRARCSLPRLSSAPTSPSGQPSASACRSASAARTPRSSALTPRLLGRCPDGSSG